MREEAIVIAALIAARDGGADLIATHADWIRETFRRACKGKHDPVHRRRDGLQYNPIAIAFVGTVLLLKNRFEMADVRTLLEAAGDNGGRSSRDDRRTPAPCRPALRVLRMRSTVSAMG